MHVEKYRGIDREDCLTIFESNTGLYFSEFERDEFLHFLNCLSQEDDYFTFRMGDKIVACGGYAPKNNYIVLTWGMVTRNLHGTGMGTESVMYRIDKIRADGLSHVIRIDTSQHTELFYKKIGFTTFKTEIDGFGKGIDRISMEYIVRPANKPLQMTTFDED